LLLSGTIEVNNKCSQDCLLFEKTEEAFKKVLECIKEENIEIKKILEQIAKLILEAVDNDYIIVNLEKSFALALEEAKSKHKYVNDYDLASIGIEELIKACFEEVIYEFKGGSL